MILRNAGSISSVNVLSDIILRLNIKEDNEWDKLMSQSTLFSSGIIFSEFNFLRKIFPIDAFCAVGGRDHAPHRGARCALAYTAIYPS